MRGLVLMALLALCSSCGFVQSANEFKGAGKLELSFPFEAIGLDSVIPNILIDFSAGFEWHNDEQQAKAKLEMLRARAEAIQILNQVNPALAAKVFDEDVDMEALLLSRLRAAVDGDE